MSGAVFSPCSALRKGPQRPAPHKVNDLLPNEATAIALLKFGADWCESCQQQIPILEGFVEDHSEEITLTHVDVEEPGNTDLKRRFEPSALPTTVVLLDDEPITQFNGVVDRDTLEATLQR